MKIKSARDFRGLLALVVALRDRFTCVLVYFRKEKGNNVCVT